MRGTMMDFPLTLPTLLERADKLFSRVEIVSRRPDRSLVRTCYGNFYRRARQLASALTKLDLRSGDRVASMMWNHSGHVEAFFGVPAAGGILHTANLRLHANEIAAIIKHAGSRFLIVDDRIKRPRCAGSACRSDASIDSPEMSATGRTSHPATAHNLINADFVVGQCAAIASRK